MHELDRCNATEFRTFLLYVGAVVLRKLLSKPEYEHFSVLHVGIRILASPVLCRQQKAYAGELVQHFVDKFEDIYGCDQMVYNLHTLGHLAGECPTHGPLDSFNAFPLKVFSES